MWGIWGSYYNIPKAIFYLRKGGLYVGVAPWGYIGVTIWGYAGVMFALGCLANLVGSSSPALHRPAHLV